MQFEYSDKVKNMQARLLAFMDEHIYPNESLVFLFIPYPIKAKYRPALELLA